MRISIHTTILITIIIVSVLLPYKYKNVHAQGIDRYVSPIGIDSGICIVESPCKTFAYAVEQSQPGDTVHGTSGNYPAETLFNTGGTQMAPITIDGEGATIPGFVLDRTNWLIIEGFNFNGVDVIDIANKSHFITIRNNIIKFEHTGLYVRSFSSHILIENNEFYQTCTQGKTWSQVKDTNCEGGAFYGSSYGGGSYYIRNNYVHDVFNAFLFTDDSNKDDDENSEDDSKGYGEWMNSNVFIYGNLITNVMDDAFEPEGDSFNIHFYSNTLMETHRMASLTTASLGPVFIYSNYLRVDGNPTNETSRYNSMLKLDLSEGFTNGVWVFNNTVFSITGNRFYPLDMISNEINNISMVNNIFNTSNIVVNDEPSFGINAQFDYNISQAGFGYLEKNGLKAPLHLKIDGTLAPTSPAISRAVEVDINGYFIDSPVVNEGSNAGAFISFSFPAWVIPPGGFPSLIPMNVEGWPARGTEATIKVERPRSLPLFPKLIKKLRGGWDNHPRTYQLINHNK